MAVCHHRGRSKVKMDQCTYEWEICNFSRCLIMQKDTVLLSSNFHMGEDKVEWGLGYFPCQSDCCDPIDFSIGLMLESAGTDHQSNNEHPVLINIPVNYEITLCNKSRTASTKVINEFTHFKHLDTDTYKPLQMSRAALLKLCQPDDTLIMLCKIQRLEIIDEDNRPITFTQQRPEFTEDFRRLLNEPNQFNDFTIIVGDKQFPVHKVILATRCPYFAKMFTHDFAENREHKMNINGSEPEIIEAVLEYIYTNQVTNLPQVAGRLVTVAHEYELDFLQTMCEEAICEALDLKNACDAMILAEKIGSQEFTEFVNTFVTDHLAEIIENAGTELDDVKRLQHVMRSVKVLKEK